MHQGGDFPAPIIGEHMLHYSLVFLLLAILAAFLGFGGLVAGAMVSIAKILFVLFLVVWAVTFFTRGPRARSLP